SVARIPLTGPLAALTTTPNRHCDVDCWPSRMPRLSSAERSGQASNTIGQSMVNVGRGMAHIGSERAIVRGGTVYSVPSTPRRIHPTTAASSLHARACLLLWLPSSSASIRVSPPELHRRLAAGAAFAGEE